MDFFHTHFKDEETEVQRCGYLSRITQEVKKPDSDLGPCVSIRILLVRVPLGGFALYGNKVDVSLWGKAVPFMV